MSNDPPILPRPSTLLLVEIVKPGDEVHTHTTSAPKARTHTHTTSAPKAHTHHIKQEDTDKDTQLDIVCHSFPKSHFGLASGAGTVVLKTHTLVTKEQTTSGQLQR